MELKSVGTERTPYRLMLIVNDEPEYKSRGPFRVLDPTIPEIVACFYEQFSANS